MGKEYKFILSQVVRLESGEQGTIIGRAEYVFMENQYNLRYVAADGRAVEAWWGESALTAI